MVLCSISSLLPSRHPAHLSRSFSKQPPPLRSPLRRRPWRPSCSLEKMAPAARESRRENRTEEEEEGEVGPVLRFEMSDFAICNYVSIGIQGRADEVVFEATVRDSKSPLYNSRVVLRELTSVQAQRRGRRALEVLKKLARRLLMYHSYAMQVHGYVAATSDGGSRNFTLVHGYHGSYSLRHWLQLSDWLPTLEATLALDEEGVRRVGDDNVGGPAVTRQLRITRILMRDLLIGVNYLHSHGLAHTQLRLENVHISPIDKHVKVGILGNAVDLYGNSPHNSTMSGTTVRKTLMIAFDMRCVGFMMAKMVLRELMDTSIFIKFKSFLTKGNDPSCLREFLLPILSRGSLSGNAGLQMLDRNWGAGWNLLSLLLATKPSERISCLDALRHPFLCGPKWRIDPSIDVIRWGLGSSTVRMAEDYIYGHHQVYKTQRRRIAYFIELMELLNPQPRRKNWLNFLSGRWRLLYCTGRHIGLTLREPSSRVLIVDAYLTFTRSPDSDEPMFLLSSDISFNVMPTSQWPHNKSGDPGNLHIETSVRVATGRRLYLREEESRSNSVSSQESIARKISSKKWKGWSTVKEPPFGLPAAKFVAGEIDVSMRFDSSASNPSVARNVLQEVRTQIPPEMFDVSKLVCGTYVDSRLLVLRGVNGSALLFTRSCPIS
ncbi:putative plastid-lipid-associated protein 14, chloroplastic isoform X2 [Iris pallida]|uniref:Plastid-lipid-associated protein 14, chloroplastic isoform X2 n=1 Tax=Iris pallida TaxID=29817 RepID=A0AAX6HKF6_IRIPA|nr:putative plastid-lipid-associated protein 14, chloroplastic isoform X2 [Iris pallida]